MIDRSPVSVLLLSPDDAGRTRRVLEGVKNQTLQPRRVLVAGGKSPDRVIRILRDWQDRLPLTILDDTYSRQGPGLNHCLDRSGSPLIALLKGQAYWEPYYLGTLVNDLKENKSLAASGGRVEIAVEASTFQYDAWAVTQHPLGTGALSYREDSNSTLVDQLQSPVYRRNALESVEGIPENFSRAKFDLLHYRLRKEGWNLKLNSRVKQFLLPKDSTAGFLKQFHEEGRGRGQLAAHGIYPSDRDETLDRALKLWTFGLCWNPIGWGLFVFYLMVDAVITVEQIQTKKSTPRLFYLLPTAHVSYWIGWLTTRFSNRSR